MRAGQVDDTVIFEQERGRLLRMAERILGETPEAEDVVQQAWIRLREADDGIRNVPAWLTTVTTRLCVDRLRKRTPEPHAELDGLPPVADPAHEVEIASSVGAALRVVLDRLTPSERVALVLHDSFAVDFPTVAEILATSPAAARKLASRARAKVTVPAPDVGEKPGAPVADQPADWEVVDAFLAASRAGDFARLLELLAPDIVVTADPAAAAAGTPLRIDGRRAVAEMFNGAARAALPVFIGERPAAAWVHRGEAKVAFDFTVVDGTVHAMQFRADPDVLRQISPRRHDERPERPEVTPAARRSSDS